MKKNLTTIFFFRDYQGTRARAPIHAARRVFFCPPRANIDITLISPA